MHTGQIGNIPTTCIQIAHLVCDAAQAAFCRNQFRFAPGWVHSRPESLAVTSVTFAEVGSLEVFYESRELNSDKTNKNRMLYERQRGQILFFSVALFTPLLVLSPRFVPPPPLPPPPLHQILVRGQGATQLCRQRCRLFSLFF